MKIMSKNTNTQVTIRYDGTGTFPLPPRMKNLGKYICTWFSDEDTKMQFRIKDNINEVNNLLNELTKSDKGIRCFEILRELDVEN